MITLCTRNLSICQRKEKNTPQNINICNNVFTFIDTRRIKLLNTASLIHIYIEAPLITIQM